MKRSNGSNVGSLIALIPKLKRKSNRQFLQLAQQRMQSWNSLIAKIESNRSVPIKPQHLVSQVSQLMNDDAVVAIDTGAHTVFTARHWKIKAGQQLAVCGNLASMAPGLPGAGMRFAFSELKTHEISLFTHCDYIYSDELFPAGFYALC